MSAREELKAGYVYNGMSEDEADKWLTVFDAVLSKLYDDIFEYNQNEG